MIYLARSLPEVAVSPASLDKDPMLLNCENGTVDLRDGELKPHNRDNLITHLCPVKYEKTSYPLWKKFLDRITDSNQVLIGYLQRLCGYWLTAQVIEQILPVLYGLGANGKTVFCETLMNILGDYAAESPPDLLVAGGNDHPTEIADLCGRRLVVASETEQGSRLKIQLVKRLTGNTKLKARFMRQDYFEFDRTHKLVLCTNNRPVIEEKTNAIWRRVKLIPFSVIIPDDEQDKDLLNKLKTEWPGILHWMVKGCLVWQQNGLMEPEEVIEATSKYRRSQDPLHDFFEECCKFDSFAVTPVSSLKERYENWITKRGDECKLSATDFNAELKKKGCEYGTKYWGGETQKCWTGLDLRG
jgi:putative DNA primase/helicase